jgi:hypothetical protein
VYIFKNDFSHAGTINGFRKKTRSNHSAYSSGSQAEGLAQDLTPIFKATISANHPRVPNFRSNGRNSYPLVRLSANPSHSADTLAPNIQPDSIVVSIIKNIGNRRKGQENLRSDLWTLCDQVDERFES